MVSSIGSSGSVGPVSSVTPASTVVTPQTIADRQSSGTLAALSQSIFTSTLATGPLGISRPLNPEDAGAILAEAELALDDTAAQSRSDRIQNTYAGARNALGLLSGRIAGAQAAVAQDGADTAQNTKVAAELSQQQSEQQVEATSLSQASAVVSGALAALAGRAPAGNQTVSRDTYVADLQSVQSGLASQVSSLTTGVADAETKAVQARTASLTAQLASVDAQIAADRGIAAPATLAQLQTTRDDLAHDLATVSTTLAADYARVLAAATGPLQAGIAALQTAIDGARDTSNASHRYSAADYASAGQPLADDAGALADQATTLSAVAAGTATAAGAAAATIMSLAADVAAQQQTVAREALALIPIFSQIAIDTVGNGLHARDAVNSKALGKGFEDLEAATRKFRDDEAAQRMQDNQQRDRQSDAVDATRVAGLVAGILAGLGDLKAVIKKETAESPGRPPIDAALTVGERFRLSL